MANYVYAIVFPDGVLRKDPVEYLGLDQNRALQYSNDVYPGSVVIKLEIVPQGV